MAEHQKVSGIWDNHRRGCIGDFLRERIKPDADTSEWEQAIDQMVYKLYGLTEEEITTVEDGE